MLGFDDEKQASNAMRAMTIIDQAVEDNGPSITDRLSISVRAGLYGLANNAIEIGNYLGVSNAETYRIADELDEVGGDLGDFYRRSSAGYDLAGDVITSLVPGGAAMWGIKAAKLGRFGARAAKSAGYFDGRLANTAQEITQRYKTVGRAADVRLLKTKAFGYATAQNAVEGAIVTAVVESSLNLGEILNDEGLTGMEKFTRFGSNVLLWGALPAPLFSVGTYKAALVAPKNALKQAVREDELKFTYASMSTRINDRPDGRLAGDKLAHTMAEMNRLEKLEATNELQSVAKIDNLALADIDAQRALSDLFPITRALGETQGKGVKSQIQPLRDWAVEKMKTPDGREEVANFFVGVEKVSPLSEDVFSVNGAVARAIKSIEPVYVDKKTLRNMGAEDGASYFLKRGKDGKHKLHIDMDYADDLRYGTQAMAHYAIEAAKDIPKLTDDLAEIETNLQVTPSADTFKRLQNAYQLRQRNPERFAQLYPNAERQFVSIGEDLSAVLYGRIMPRYLDTKTGAVVSTPVQQLGDLQSLNDLKSISTVHWKDAQDNVFSVSAKDLDRMEQMDNLMAYQAARVIAGRSDTALKAVNGGARRLENYTAADIARLDAWLTRGDRKVVRDGVDHYTLPGTKQTLPVQEVHQFVADFKGREVERLIQAQPDRAAQGVLNTVGVSENFLLNRGAVSKLEKDDLFINPSELMERRTYVAQQRADLPDEATLDVMSYLESQRADDLQTLRATANRVMGQDLTEVLPEISSDFVENMGWSRFWQGASTIGDYQSLNAKTSYVGNWVTHQADRLFNAEIYPEILRRGRLVSGSKEASAEYLGLYEWYVQQSGKFYALTPDIWVSGDVRKSVARAVADGTPVDRVLQSLRQGRDYYQIRNKEALNYVTALQSLNKQYILGKKMAIEQAYGNTPAIEFEALYLPPRNFKHVDFIDAEAGSPLDVHSRQVLRVTGRTAEELEERVQRALSSAAKDGKKWRRITNKQIRDYKIATQSYEWAGDELSTGYAQSSYTRAGATQNLIPETDVTQLMADNAEWFKRQNLMVHRGAVEMHYADTISALNSMTRMEQNLASSSLETVDGVVNAARSASRAKSAGDYEQVLHQMIGHDEKGYSIWAQVNNSLETWAAKLASPINNAIQRVRGKDDPQLWQESADLLEKELAANGIKLPFKEVLTDSIARNTDLVAADVRGAVSSVNHVLSTVLLRLDTADGLVNVLGYFTKAGSEMNYLRRVAASADDATKGNFEKEFKRLFGAGQVPTSSGNITLPTTAKTMSEGIKRMLKPEGKADIDRWVEEGLLIPSDQIMRDMFEELTIDPKAFRTPRDIKAYEAKVRAAGNKAFNVLSASSNASNLLTQYSALHAAETLGKAAGLADGELKAFMFSLSRRINAITNPTQKPRLFQGAAGIALSLYQSFMFHTLSNITRYLDYGNKSAPVMLAALNSTFFGASSLPGFNYINTTLVGRGAEDGHQDLYGATATGLGRPASDFLMYGAASFLLQGSLYTRGNMTPRTPVLIPTNFSELPVTNALASVIGNTIDLASKVKSGEPILQSTMDSVVNMGLNRPLTGLATIIRGNAIDNNYNNVMVHDDVFSLASALRITGIRPINEQIVRDYQYRLMSYRAEDAAKKIALGAQMRRMFQANPNIFNEDAEFLMRMERKYIRAGGNTKNFDGFLEDSLTKATDDLSLRLEDHVKTNADALSQYRNIMGGY